MIGRVTCVVLITITLEALTFLALADDGAQQSSGIAKKYEANWTSLDSRPLPEWYDEAKVGVFIHWGVFSVPSYGNEWFWWNLELGAPKYVEFMKKNYKPGFTYQEFAPQLTAEFFDAERWANVLQKSGARYLVLNTKHHDGFTLWKSTHHHNWNSVDLGPHVDLLAELANALKKTGIRFGTYHSLMEWFDPAFNEDHKNHWTTRTFPTQKLIPTLKELINLYKPEILWSDGDWKAPDTYWGSEEFLAWLYNDSPVKDTVVTNDRWGDKTRGVHGGFFNYGDRFNPGKLLSHKWENAFTLDKRSWGYRRDATLQEIMTPEELISQIVTTVSCGGNALVNIGPTREGTIPLIFEERLSQMGEWLQINGEAIYGSVPWSYQNDTVTENVWYTTNRARTKVYAILLQWPGTNVTLSTLSKESVTSITMLGFNGQLDYSESKAKGIQITLPRRDENRSKWAWVIVINLMNIESNSVWEQIYEN